MPAPRSSLVFLVPEADPLVGRLRLAHDPAARAGLNAHVTLLFPFVPPESIDGAVLNRLEDQFARDPEISGDVELRFNRLARFPDGVLYLALADGAVKSKIRALGRAWPEYPPYEGRFLDSVPHLTVAHGDEEVLASAEAELASALPLVVNVRFASLIVEDDAERWQERTRFALHR